MSFLNALAESSPPCNFLYFTSSFMSIIGVSIMGKYFIYLVYFFFMCLFLSLFFLLLVARMQAPGRQRSFTWLSAAHGKCFVCIICESVSDILEPEKSYTLPRHNGSHSYIPLSPSLGDRYNIKEERRKEKFLPAFQIDRTYDSDSSEVKVSAYDVGDPGSIPGSGRSPGEGSGNSLQCSCLENPMDGEAWWATVHGIAKSRTRLSDFTSLHDLRTIFFFLFLNFLIYEPPNWILSICMAMPCSLWDLCSPTRGWTCGLGSESTEL